MLDKFWNVASVRSWFSRKLIQFFVIAAAGTSAGIKVVRQHRVSPKVVCATVVPTIHSDHNATRRDRWFELFERYGPSTVTGADKQGFGASGALIAFSYGIPNNAPVLLHESSGFWKPLYVGPAPPDLDDLFDISDPRQRIDGMGAAIGVELLPTLPLEDARLSLALRAAGRRWREGSEVALAEMTGFTVPEVLVLRRRAIKVGLLDVAGRLTDHGHRFLDSTTRSRRNAKVVEANAAPYYPKALRILRR